MKNQLSQTFTWKRKLQLLDWKDYQHMLVLVLLNKVLLNNSKIDLIFMYFHHLLRQIKNQVFEMEFIKRSLKPFHIKKSTVLGIIWFRRYCVAGFLSELNQFVYYPIWKSDHTLHVSHRLDRPNPVLLDDFQHMKKNAPVLLVLFLCDCSYQLF